MLTTAKDSLKAHYKSLSYYSNKIPSLTEIFGEAVQVFADHITVGGSKRFPVVDDVIITLEPWQFTAKVRRALHNREGMEIPPADREEFARAIQDTFGQEWSSFSEVLPQTRVDFERYFDLVDLNQLIDARTLDLGCGIGRWSYFLHPFCREIVLMDFSDAIFLARKNLAASTSAIYVMGDILRMPFAKRSFDFIYSVGVLHHLPTDGLSEVRKLAQYSSRVLIYLYYNLDNKPRFHRLLLRIVTGVRGILSGIRSERLRMSLSWAIASFIYAPFVALGKVLNPLGLATNLPLYHWYRDKTLFQLQQDAYDRFFTGIEQRFSRQQILQLKDTFEEVRVSDGLPYWHFLCESPKTMPK